MEIKKSIAIIILDTILIQCVGTGITAFSSEKIRSENVTIVKSDGLKVYTDIAMTQELKNLSQYVYPKEVALNFNGTATLDGKEIKSGIKVTDAGVHIVNVTNGSEKKTYNFSVINNINGKDIISISLGKCNSASITNDGILYMWGKADYKRKNGSILPMKMNGKGDINESTRIVSVSLGYSHNAAIDSDGNLYAWGENSDGELGDGTNINRDVPIKINGKGDIGENTKIVSVSLGLTHSAAVDSEGKIYTWGANEYGELGNGNKNDISSYVSKNSPVKINGKGDINENTKIVSVSLGGYHSAAVDSEGNLYTWGKNGDGELGDGTNINRNSPVKINGGGVIDEKTKIISVSLGGYHSAAVDSEGNLYTWGLNEYGELGIIPGIKEENSVNSPIKINGEGDIGENTKIVSVSLGLTHSAAVDSEGNLYTWGLNGDGELGDGTDINKYKPVKINGSGSIGEKTKIVSISLGLCHSAATDNEGNLYTWGSNKYGELGSGITYHHCAIPKVSILTLKYGDITRKEDVDNIYFNCKFPENLDTGAKSLTYILDDDTSINYATQINLAEYKITIPKASKANKIKILYGFENINTPIIKSFGVMKLKGPSEANVTVEHGKEFNSIDFAKKKFEVIGTDDTFDDGLTINVDKEKVNLSKSGDVVINYKIIDRKGNYIKHKLILHIKNKVAISKLAYFKTYGLVLEGEVIETKNPYDMSVKKTLVVESSDGNIKFEKNIINTNWYGNGYSGFQGIITSDDLDRVGDLQNAKIAIKTNSNGKIETYDYTVEKTELLSKIKKPIVKISEINNEEANYYKIENLPVGDFGNSIIAISVDKNNQLLLSNSIKKFDINTLSYYKNNTGNYIFDASINIKDFNLENEGHVKLFEVKDKLGKIVYTGKAATFEDGVFENVAPKSALQVVIPIEYSNDDYFFEIVIKDKNNIEKARFKVPKY
ncbi:RCC1 domain-containing protein [Clostridium sardiniense]|uniref:RCC1 domain-containing protein n=1 Tax=Clostridium sardiniense TaxID=29369 RepID=UPI0019574DBB|nr:hypothetical protein [Clostridium sardiniense]MBM7835589.1 hypothetical protein [Clostridium sardiniense]